MEKESSAVNQPLTSYIIPGFFLCIRDMSVQQLVFQLRCLKYESSEHIVRCGLFVVSF